MPFSFRFTRLSSLLASPLVALALQAQAEQLQPPKLIAVRASDVAQEGPLTPMDQGTSPEDVRITQLLRQTLTHNRALSIDAQNVKIITREGVVTLRGQVQNTAEKSAVAMAAKRTEGVKRVDDQLELDAKPQ
ncbi:MAG TPA: BON domain-containing protein [Myxococcota bacterium]|nr:BON domain-containing protein [Myxococcota bacterium]